MFLVQPISNCSCVSCTVTGACTVHRVPCYVNEACTIYSVPYTVTGTGKVHRALCTVFGTGTVHRALCTVLGTCTAHRALCTVFWDRCCTLCSVQKVQGFSRVTQSFMSHWVQCHCVGNSLKHHRTNRWPWHQLCFLSHSPSLWLPIVRTPQETVCEGRGVALFLAIGIHLRDFKGCCYWN